MFRIVSGLFSGLFVVSAALQYNDPDPIQWAAIYLAAAVAAGWAAWKREPRWLPLIVGAVALVWAAIWAPGVISSGMWRDFGKAMGPGSGAEEARELGGLLIVAGWMTVLALRRRRA